jgi:hypothetical protein
MLNRFAPILVLTVFLTACGEKPVADMKDLESISISLPHGETIRAEVLMRKTDKMRGMMFRDALPPDRGMLFIYGAQAKNAFWTYQVKIPLDIIWLDRQKNIVEISPNTPPCTTNASQCPFYGGNALSTYVLEMSGGMAARYGLKVGDSVRF